MVHGGRGREFKDNFPLLEVLVQLGDLIHASLIRLPIPRPARETPAVRRIGILGTDMNHLAGLDASQGLENPRHQWLKVGKAVTRCPENNHP